MSRRQQVSKLDQLGMKPWHVVVFALLGVVILFAAVSGIASALDRPEDTSVPTAESEVIQNPYAEGTDMHEMFNEK